MIKQLQNEKEIERLKWEIMQLKVLFVANQKDRKQIISLIADRESQIKKLRFENANLFMTTLQKMRDDKLTKIES